MPYEKIGGFWNKTTRNGDKMLSGKLTKTVEVGTYLFVFRNKEKKKGEKTATGTEYPDFNIYRQL